MPSLSSAAEPPPSRATATTGWTARLDKTHVHAVTSFGSTAYSYDANGSMVRRGATSIRYDAERRPVRVSEGPSVLWRASYDGDGARRKRVDGKGTVHYLGGYERNVGNGTDTTETITKYYRALGRMIAFRRNGTLYWVGTDHLGGTVRVANSSFAPIAQMRYMPYGASRDNTDETLTDYLFTSQQLDASIGLYWYGSRAYDPELGRFTCADTIVPSAGNPQSLNRYSYTYNNPLKYVDPTGHYAELDDYGGGWWDDSYGEDTSGSYSEPEDSYDYWSSGYSDGSSNDVGAGFDGSTVTEYAQEEYAQEEYARDTFSDFLDEERSYNDSQTGGGSSGGGISEVVSRAASYLSSSDFVTSRTVDAVFDTLPRIAAKVPAIEITETVGMIVMTPTKVQAYVAQVEVFVDLPAIAHRAAKAAARTAPVVSGAIQLASDRNDPTLSDGDRALRAGVAIGAGMIGLGIGVAAAPGWAAMATVLAVGIALDVGKDWLLFPAMGYGTPGSRGR